VLGCKSQGTDPKNRLPGFVRGASYCADGISPLPLYVNLTACGACRNSFIVERLKNVFSARTTFFDIGKRILAAQDLVFAMFPDGGVFSRRSNDEFYAGCRGFRKERHRNNCVVYGEKDSLKRNIIPSSGSLLPAMRLPTFAQLWVHGKDRVVQ
jgi:hypothetical protein